MNNLFSVKYKLSTLKWKDFKELKIKFISSSVLGGFCRPINRRLVDKIKKQIEKRSLLPIPFVVISSYLVDGSQRFAAIHQIHKEAVEKKKIKLVEEIENMDFPILEILSELDILESIKLLNCGEKLKATYFSSYSEKVLIELNNRKDSPFKFKIKIDENGPGKITKNKILNSKSFKKLIKKATKLKIDSVILANTIINSGFKDLEEAIENVVIN